MKKPLSPIPTASVPRLNSLLHRLQHAPGAEDESYLDQLMIFLDDPPPGTGDRWKEGAAMCAGWGIVCSHTSVWRLYRSHVIEWRLRLAAETSMGEGETPEVIAEKIDRLVKRRTFEVLAHPQSNAGALVGLARLAIRQQTLDLARKKHEAAETKDIDKAINGLSFRVMFNREASFALERLKEALKRPPMTMEEYFAHHGEPTNKRKETATPHAPHA